MYYIRKEINQHHNHYMYPFLPETSDWLVSARKRHFPEVSGHSCGEDGWTDGQTDNVFP